MLVELQGKFKKLVTGSFFKNVTILMSGTAIAQGIAFAASPILSRLYEPATFGIFGIFTAVCGILTVVASAKYELAILLPEKDEDAANILWLSIGVIVGISSLSFLIILFFRDTIAALLGSPDLASLLWGAPVSILCAGLYNTFNYWTTRQKQFNRLSISRVIQTTGREGTQMGLGFLSSLKGSGLVIGYVFGQASSAAALIIQTFKDDYKLIKKSFSIDRIKALAKEHHYFPKYDAPQDLINSFSKLAPPFLLAYFFSPMVVGFYWFTHRILVAPNKLIGNSIRQVYYQHANELIHKNKGLWRLYIKSTGTLALLGLVPLLIIILFGPNLFGIIFGSKWIEGGQYAQWLILWWYAGFINPPSVMTIPIYGLQKLKLYYETILAILRAIALSIGGILNDPMMSIALFSLVGMIANVSLVLFVGFQVRNRSTSS